MKVWELHSQTLDGAIRTTPDGEADIGGLIVSEKAYLLLMRDHRPGQVVDMVQRHGPANAANALCAHYNTEESLAASGGRGLAITRSGIGGVGLVRADEADEAVGRRR